jgi:hypothetical protein
MVGPIDFNTPYTIPNIKSQGRNPADLVDLAAKHLETTKGKLSGPPPAELASREGLLAQLDFVNIGADQRTRDLKLAAVTHAVIQPLEKIANRAQVEEAKFHILNLLNRSRP